MTNRTTIPTEDVLRAREKLVLDHFHDEVAHAWDKVLSTFPHPHYELIAMLKVHDGEREVRDYFIETRRAFPDQDHEIISIRHSADAVIVEFWLTGTHKGPLGRIPPTGGRHRTRMTAFFIFDAQERLICERVYFDSLTMLKQVLGGINLKNPRHWPRALQALRGLLTLSNAPDPRLVNTPKFDL